MATKRKKQDQRVLERSPEGKRALARDPLEGQTMDNSATDGSHWNPSAAMIRETVESVIIAFVLAFVFRTFEAEAFVIPTGSMAPTLMGKHKDVKCEICGTEFQASASDSRATEREEAKEATVNSATCPMCRHSIDLTPKNKQQKSFPSYDGDRILVAKFPYEIAEPHRWDVFVFKYPGDATMNYIKRLTGLPGETVSIHNGDLWIHTSADKPGDFHIARKPPEKILAMLQPVYDNDLASKITGQIGMAGAMDAAEGDKVDWKVSPGKTSFRSEGTAGDSNWIRYRHLVPTCSQWNEMEALWAILKPNDQAGSTIDQRFHGLRYRFRPAAASQSS